jgi:molybdopterin-guanine dinucleotide biosynthesis protein A
MPHHGAVTWAAVVLTGGTGVRLGGRDKATLELAGRSLLDHALTAVAAADEVVVVGPQVPAVDARFVREDPPGGGPLAGVAAGVAALAAGHDRVVVLAVDMPGVTAATVARLLAASANGDAAWLVDGSGRRQLAGAVRPSLVPRPADARGSAMRLLMTAGDTRDVAGLEGEAADVDTWDDLVRLRAGDGPETTPGGRT